MAYLPSCMVRLVPRDVFPSRKVRIVVLVVPYLCALSPLLSRWLRRLLYAYVARVRLGVGSALPSFPSRHTNISVVVWDSICALSALFGVGSDVHLVPTTYEFDGPLVASFRDRLASSYMGSGLLYAYVARVRLGVGYALPSFPFETCVYFCGGLGFHFRS